MSFNYCVRNISGSSDEFSATSSEYMAMKVTIVDFEEFFSANFQLGHDASITIGSHSSRSQLTSINTIVFDKHACNCLHIGCNNATMPSEIKRISHILQ